jgi:deoxyribonuclease IV
LRRNTSLASPPLVGAHMSIAGGVWRAFERGALVGANCIQVFVKSTVQWRTREVADEDVDRFRQEQARTGIAVAAAHASYLINPATSNRAIRAKSRSGLKVELDLAGRYGIPWLVFHGGNHMGAGLKAGIANVAEAVKETLAAVQGGTGLALEMTAGAGTAVASRLEEAAEIVDRAGGGKRVALCLDTAHLFAAGYDIRSDEGYAEFKRALRRLGLLKRVAVIHANDSKGAFESHVDRHTHIGKGRIGRKAFARLMQDRDFARVPKILETPKGMCGRRSCDAVYIALLRRLAARPAPAGEKARR